MFSVQVLASTLQVIMKTLKYIFQYLLTEIHY
jgi:hypothetical protein